MDDSEGRKEPEVQPRSSSIQKILFALFCVAGVAYLIAQYLVVKHGERNPMARGIGPFSVTFGPSELKDALELVLVSSVLTAAVHTWYLQSTSDANYRLRQTNAYKAVFSSLMLAIVDYFLKSVQFSKNIFFYPLGVDSRVFSRQYRKIEYSGECEPGKPTVWKLAVIENRYCSPFKIWSGTLCFLTFFIAIWVAHSVAKTFSPFIVELGSLRFYTIALAVSVFLCDVAIIRIATKLHTERILQHGASSGVEKGKKSEPGAKLAPFAIGGFRLAVILATATLLAFSFSLPFLESSLTDRLRQQEKDRILREKSSVDLGTARVNLANRIYQLNAKQFCAAFAFSGIKEGELVFKSEKNWPIALANLSPSGVEDNSASAFPPPDVNCNQYLNTDEPPCRSADAISNCPNATRLARDVFLIARDLFGLSAALSNYNLGNVSRLIISSTTQERLPDQKNSKPTVEAYEEAISGLNNRLKEAAKLQVETSFESRCASTVASGAESNDLRSLEAVFGLIKAVIIPAPLRWCPESSTGKIPKPKLDLNTAAEVFFSQFSNIFSTAKGMFFALAVVVVMAAFELLVVIYKVYGQFPVLEHLNARLLSEYYEYLNQKDDIASYQILTSEMDFSADWRIIDHLYHITVHLMELCKTYMVSPLSGFAIMLAPGAVFIYLLMKGLTP